jgi:hypothetical protein
MSAPAGQGWLIGQIALAVSNEDKEQPDKVKENT